MKKYNQGTNNPSFKDGRTMLKKKCSNCGTQLSNYIAKRCHSCAMKYVFKKGKIIVAGKNNPNYKDGRSSKSYVCKCGNKITINTALYGKGKCQKCVGILSSKRMKRCNPNTIPGMKEQQRIRMSGNKNHSWVDGRSYKNYPKEFTPALKDLIRKRDNYQCQNPECNMTEEEHIIVYGRVLDVHHIDYNKKNCKETNLITLCKQCNIRANSNRNYWQERYTPKI